MALDKLILKVKRGESPFFSFLRLLIISFSRMNFPYFKPIHLPLYHGQNALRLSFKWIIHFLWSVPLFKSRCTQVGRNLSIPNGIPLVMGNHLKIFLGDDVTIFRTVFGASKVYDEAVLKIGHRSIIGYGTALSIAKEVEIGDNVMIGPMCMIMDNDDHPINPDRRLRGEGVAKGEVAPVKIGNNVWIGAYSTILKGVRVGDNSVITAHSVVTRDVMENCVYAGFPARPTVRDIHKKDFLQKAKKDEE